MKQCFKCGMSLPLSEFYRHSRMADGHLGKCKQCTKADVKQNYVVRREGYREYERIRNSGIDRRKAKRGYEKRHRELNPDKGAARHLLGNAVRDGRIVRLPCEVCGTTADVEAHHHDYSKPLDVKWLCFKHHRELEHGQVVGKTAA